MRLREEVLHLLAGLDIPIRNLSCLHRLQHLRLQALFSCLALTHMLHRFKSQAGLHALAD